MLIFDSAQTFAVALAVLTYTTLKSWSVKMQIIYVGGLNQLMTLS